MYPKLHKGVSHHIYAHGLIKPSYYSSDQQKGGYYAGDTLLFDGSVHCVSSLTVSMLMVP